MGILPRVNGAGIWPACRLSGAALAFRLQRQESLVGLCTACRVGRRRVAGHRGRLRHQHAGVGMRPRGAALDRGCCRRFPASRPGQIPPATSTALSDMRSIGLAALRVSLML